MNLNERDPYYILVILMVVTMFISTKMTTTDPKQKFITYILPVVFGAISWQFPSGILVYWVTTNIWSIGQQYIVNRLVKREAKKTEEKEKKVQEQKKLERNIDEKIAVSKKKKKKKKKKRRK
jgi:YidC/Oxa1 family membrane protein insertase